MIGEWILFLSIIFIVFNRRKLKAIIHIILESFSFDWDYACESIKNVLKEKRR